VLAKKISNMKFVTAKDGAKLFYKDWGVGAPVILIHGWPLSADTWDHLGMTLADNDFRVIAYDRRGFGRSTQSHEGYDYDTLSDDLAAVMQEAGADGAALVGFSMGGGEIARYMSRHGGSGVSKAVLISSVVPYMLKTDDNPNGVPQEVFDEMAGGMSKDRASFFADFFPTFYGNDLVKNQASDELVEWSRSVAMQASLKATLDCATSFATTDFRPDLEHFNCETLLIHGTGDETVPIDATSRAAAKIISGAEFLGYENAPHGLIATHKEKVAEDVLRFLKK
jgi:pimeloyl-ACP methyl ester carboxylesterase